MKEQTLNEMLLEAFPKLTEDFKTYVEWQDGIDTGAFLTYEDVFRPFIENAIANNNNVNVAVVCKLCFNGNISLFKSLFNLF